MIKMINKNFTIMMIMILGINIINKNRCEATPPQMIDQQRIAVIELRNDGDLKLHETQSLTETTRGVVAEMLGDRYLIITRENMRSFMDEQTCNNAMDQSCEIEVGRLIGAHFIISGAVRRLGKTFMVTLKVHSTIDGRLLGARVRQAYKVEDLSSHTRVLSKEITQLIRPSSMQDIEWIKKEPNLKLPKKQKRKRSSTPNIIDHGNKISSPEEIDWVKLPGGQFKMGSMSDQLDEGPIHTVNVSPFYISKTEVTVAQYRKCVDVGVCSEPNIDVFCTWSKTAGLKEQHPINCLDWSQARTFAKWVSADLPTEAEWEFAARGGEDLTYSGSNTPDEVAWYTLNTHDSGTQPVATKKANGYGLYDMSGNVWEWVLDEYADNYEIAPSDGHKFVGNLPKCTVRCSYDSSHRVYRGGNWEYDATYLRITDRNEGSPDDQFDVLGFRVSKPIKP